MSFWFIWHCCGCNVKFSPLSAVIPKITPRSCRRPTRSEVRSSGGGGRTPSPPCLWRLDSPPCTTCLIWSLGWPNLARSVPLRPDLVCPCPLGPEHPSSCPRDTVLPHTVQANAPRARFMPLGHDNCAFPATTLMLAWEIPSRRFPLSYPSHPCPHA